MRNRQCIQPPAPAVTPEQATLKYRMFAALYFPVQFFAVRFAVLGFSPTPTPGDIYSGFRIAEIAHIVQDFLTSIPDVVNAEHIVFIIYNALPYVLRLAVQLIPLAAFCYTFFALITFLRAQLSILLHPINMDNIVSVRVGQPGSGKSSSAGYDAVAMARKKWAELKYKYWSMQKHVTDYIAEGNVQKMLEWYEVRDSYEYYITHDCVPCLWCNMPMLVGGQNVSMLKYEHAAQIERLPSFGILYFDEVGSILRNQMSQDKVLTVSDFLRLCRHFGEWNIITTEQEETNIYIDFRRVVSENRYMLSQKWVNKPWLLLIPYNLIKRYFSQNENAGKKWMSAAMQELNRVIRHIGQRKYRYVNRQNTEMQLKRRDRKHTIFLPTMLNYQYNDRTYKNLYLAKNKQIQSEIFGSLLLADTAQNTARYLKTSDTTKARMWFDGEDNNAKAA